MLVATPGQTTAYALHNNNSGNTTSTANIPAASAVSSTATSSSCSAVTATKKQTALNNSSSTGMPKTVNNNSHINNNTSATTTTATINQSSVNHHSNFNFHAPPNKKDLNNIPRNSSITASSKDTHSQSQHSFKNSNMTRPPSFLTALKDTVQKALVTTASSLPKNGSNQNTTATALNTSNTTTIITNNTSTKPIIASASSSSSSSVATTKNSSNTIITTAASSSSSTSSASTILPSTVARKKFTQAIATQPKLHTIPPTILHRYPEERQKSSSTDSLQKEMCHFKPIRTAPTTPWKSGSKSRGSSLRFPKANLATTKTEFILKSNCDVNNRKKKQQMKVKQNDQEISSGGKTEEGGDGDDNDEQENREYYEIYKPKPSSLYSSTSLATPNHQSAFVCLVANIMNIQSAKSVAAPSSKGDGDGMGLQKSKSTRAVGRTKETGASTKAAATTVAVKELFVRHKKFKSPLPPPPITARKADLGISVTRSQRFVGKSTSVFSEESQKSAKSNKLPTKVTRTKSRRKLKGAKSNTMENVQLVKASSQTTSTDNADHTAAGKSHVKSTVQRNSRKRKVTPEVSGPGRGSTTSALSKVPAAISSLGTSTASARKIARLSVESYSNHILFKHPELHLSTARPQDPSQRNVGNFSPPMTRSRLKQWLNQHHFQEGSATSSVIDAKKRKDLAKTRKSDMSTL